MKHVDEYRDGKLARDLARRIAAEARADHAYRFMEFCGGHTHAISRYGVEDLLPANIRIQFTAPAVPSACCRWAASTTRSRSPSGRK